MNYSTMLEAVVKQMDEDSTYNAEMAAAVELWSRMYRGTAPWIDNEKTFSAGIPNSIASEMARMMTIEVKATVEGSKVVDDSLQSSIMPKLRKYTEYGLAKGSLIIKPIVTMSGLITQFIQADNFFPLAFDSSGNLTRCVLIEQKRSGKTIYTRMEIYNIVNGVLTVENRAFKSESDGVLGSRIELSTVPEWANLADEQSFTGTDKLPFGFFRCPLANHIDTNSPLGVSIYSRAVEHIKEADRRYSDICWEFESKQTAVHMAESMLEYDHTTGKYKAPAGKERLYRALPYSTGAVDHPLIDVYSPAIRSSEYFEGYNQQLRMIEFDCSLAYGTISDPNTVDRTATEIEASKQRSFTMISDCQNAMEDALTDWANGALFWSRLYGLETSASAKLGIDWGDSILSNPQLEREEDRKDLANGTLRPEEYRAKWRDETIEEALANLPQTAMVME
jgi:A118 family predicted phage portal protein